MRRVGAVIRSSIVVVPSVEGFPQLSFEGQETLLEAADVADSSTTSQLCTRMKNSPGMDG